MEIKRFFVDPSSVSGDRCVVTGEEYVHIAVVTRHKIGYRLILCTGDGYDIYGTIEDIKSDKVIVRIDERVVNIAEWDRSMTLYQSVAKGDKMDVIVQKAIELGVRHIVPFYSAQSQRDINLSRLNKIAREAAKQCGRAICVQVAEPIYFEDIPIESYDRVYFPSERERNVNYRDLTCFDGSNFALIVGSEGGFDSDESNRLVERGCVSFSLGNRILRAETAVITTLSLLANSLGEMTYKDK